MTDLNEDLVQDTSNTNQKHNSLDAHLITTVNRDILIAPNVENIIEEEEEEEIEKRLDENEKELDKKSVQIQLSPAHLPETSKFKLEAVVLENEIDTKKSNELIEISANMDKKKDEKPVEEEVTEIKVEEGYATRQMDEYFRQTIQAIKEELTKNLKNKNENQSNQYNSNHKHHRNQFYNPNEDDIDEYESDSDFDDELNDEDKENLDIENQNDSHLDEYECNCDLSITNRNFNNRNLLFQHLLSLTNKKPNKTEKLTSWFVLLGCFLNQFIIDGLCFNYSNLFVFIQKEFKDTSKLIASLPGTLLLMFYLLLAPISIFLTKQYGSRRIAIIGSFISTISLLISSFITNIVAFTIFYGVFTGIGISLIYIPSLIATSKWFLKKRLFANSLTILGACIGAGVYPLISEFILKKYNLFDTLLILSGIQFNCLVGSMLLKDHKSAFSISFRKNKKKLKKKSTKTKATKSQSSAQLIDLNDQSNDSTNNNVKNNTSNDKSLQLKAKKIDRLISVDSETESNTSVSTGTVTNYTLKQYWRKFVQTRKTPANAKKNLFHLIAEEKRKTRTLSKTSLEDGFVITTSNRLLAPNDESNVIVTRQTKLAISTNTHSSRAASKFFSRIANSLRSLTHSSSNQASSSPINNSIHSKINIPPQINSPVNIQDINEISKQSTPTPSTVIPLMNVFNGPLTDQVQNQDQQNEITNEQQSSPDPIEEENNLNSDSDEESSPPTNYFTNMNKHVNIGAKNSRYLSYRNSLTSSVRGSLMECSVPEDREEETDVNSGGDGNSSVNEEDEYYNNNTNNQNRRLSQRQPRRRSHLTQRSASYNCKRFHSNPVNNSRQNGDAIRLKVNTENSTVSSYNNVINNNSNYNNNSVGYALPTFLNLRRFISTIEGSSFYNVPVNLETIEYNLRNSLIKKCSESYRKQQKLNRVTSDHHNMSISTLFLDYLAYLTSFKLLKNSLFFYINLSFMLNIIGFIVILFYICEYTRKFDIKQHQSAYVLSLIGLMTGFGRIISTISYKVNESNAKGRIFAYVLTLILNGSCILTAIVLCDTAFSFYMFAISFGILLGFNLNLRSLFIYDIVGLEWSDDSLFSYGVVSQSIGVSIGLPIAGLIFDMTNNVVNVLYFAASCFILSGLILIPGRKLRLYCESSFKSINKFYLQRKI